MKFYEEDPKKINSKGAPIFKKMLEDKKLISSFLQQGKDMSELKHKIGFGKPLHV